MSDFKLYGTLTVVGFIVLVLTVSIFLFGGPTYHVYSQHMAGKAELARATYNRQIAVQEAHAKMDAATMLAKAEIERAKGVAQANQIIGESLKDNREYLQWLYIEGLKEGGNDVIYVPTEFGWPTMLLEASRDHNK